MVFMKKIDIQSITEEDILQFIALRIHDKRFAIEISHIREIIRYQKPSPLPNAPDFIDGIIDLRGEIIPIIDLRKRFLSPVSFQLSTRILIIKSRGRIIGLAVDEASEVITLPIKEIKPPPPLYKLYAAKYIIGIISYNKNLYLILDAEKLLTEEEKVSIEKLAIG